MTIKDLAKKTGYGVATVSRVLNNRPDVSETARRVILRAAEESGFQLNSNAKQLRQQSSNAILVVVKGTSNEMFAELLEILQALMAGEDFPVYVDYMDENGNEVQRAVNLCIEKKPVGIIFLGGNSQNFLADFHRIDIPCVLVTNDASQLGFSNLSSVCTDDSLAAKSAVEALIELGHRSFAIVGGDRLSSDTSRLRYEGCMQAFEEHSIVFDNEAYQGVRFSYQDGYQAAEKLIDSGISFSALFAASDVMAIGAMRALADRGLKVPEDVSVMGFDGLPLSSYLVPKLSTVRQSLEEMASLSVEILISQIKNGGEPRHVSVPFTLCKRESVRRL